MPRMTKLKTDASTLLPPGEGLRRFNQRFKLKQTRQQAEINVVNNPENQDAKKAKALAILAEKHHNERGK